MAAIIICPDCDKKIKGPDDVKGKKVRCPGCGATFVAENVTVSGGGQAAAKAAAKAPAGEDEDETSNPYGIGFIEIKARCPNCANAMESEVAVICLFCGYNTLTRKLGETKKVLAHTAVDRTKWLMPGIGCAAGILVVILLDITFVYGLGASTRGSDRWYWQLATSESIRLWTVLLSMAGVWALGQFAYKRLLLEPTPPEEELL